MDKLNSYQKIIEDVFSHFQKLIKKTDKSREILLSIDQKRGQYLLVSDTRKEGDRHYQTLMHVELKHNSVVWLRVDITDLELGQELVKRGIERKDIIPAFHSETIRKYTTS